MEITEKVAYLKGLAEGMELDTEKKEGKLLAAIIDVLDDIALEIADMKADQAESLNIDIAPVIADVFADGVFTAVIHQEMRAIDPFSGGRIDLMDEKTAERLIFNADRGGLAAFNLEIMRRIV